MSSNEITIIYDGLCQFCKNCVDWVQKKVVVTAIDYQSADLKKFRLTEDQCEKQVYVIASGKTYGGVDALSFLLRIRKNQLLFLLLKITGPLGGRGYQWVAQNRNSALVRGLNKVIIWMNKG